MNLPHPIANPFYDGTAGGRYGILIYGPKFRPDEALHGDTPSYMANIYNT
jgi:hypothetical protein